MSDSSRGEHDPLLGGEHSEPLGGEQIATYREIAAHWRLKGWEDGDGVDAARVKAKRAGWRQLSRNHPADPVRVAIPQAVWDAATLIGGRAAPLDGDDRRDNAIPPSKRNAIPESGIASVLASLDEHRDQARAARESIAQAQAELAAARKEATEARERAARLEGELDGVKLATEHLHDQLTQATRQRDEALSLSLERKAAADAEQRAREAAEATLERLQSRGVWARLRNRP
jgi:hypothetical protein